MNNTSFIDDWAILKEEIKKLEARCKLYRKKAEKIMNQENMNTLYGNNYKVDRREKHISRITKANLPQDIWDQYSTISSSQCYYVKRTCHA